MILEIYKKKFSWEHLNLLALKKVIQEKSFRLIPIRTYFVKNLLFHINIKELGLKPSSFYLKYYLPFHENHLQQTYFFLLQFLLHN